MRHRLTLRPVPRLSLAASIRRTISSVSAGSTSLFPFGSEHWRSYFLGELSPEQMLRAALWPTVGEPVPYANENPSEKYEFTFEEGVPPRLVES